MASTDRGLELIAQYNSKNEFAQLLGMQLFCISDGIVEYHLEICSQHLATPGFAHGGVLTTLLDATMGAGALTMIADEGKVVSTIEMHVNFLQPIQVGDFLVARSSTIRKGKKVIFMNCEVKNQQNKLVAVSKGTFFPLDATRTGYQF